MTLPIQIQPPVMGLKRCVVMPCNKMISLLICGRAHLYIPCLCQDSIDAVKDKSVALQSTLLYS